MTVLVGGLSGCLEVPEFAGPLAADSYQRESSFGWENADVGGAWSHNAYAAFTVEGGQGRVDVAPGADRDAYLEEVAALSTDLSAELSTDLPVDGSGVYIRLTGRQRSNGEYRTTIWVAPDGEVNATVQVRVNTEVTNLAGPAVLPLSFASGDRLAVRFQVSETEPTLLFARVWPADQPEPSEWLVTATDSTGSLQAPGFVGFSVYLSQGSASPVVVLVDDLMVISTD